MACGRQGGGVAGDEVTISQVAGGGVAGIVCQAVG